MGDQPALHLEGLGQLLGAWLQVVGPEQREEVLAGSRDVFEDQALLGQIGQRYLLLAGQRMVRRQQGIRRHLCQNSALDLWVQAHVISQRQFCLALVQAPVDPGKVGFEQSHGDFRVALAKATEQARRVPRAQVLEADQAEIAAQHLWLIPALRMPAAMARISRACSSSCRPAGLSSRPRLA